MGPLQQTPQAFNIQPPRSEGAHGQDQQSNIRTNAHLKNVGVLGRSNNPFDSNFDNVGAQGRGNNRFNLDPLPIDPLGVHDFTPWNTDQSVHQWSPPSYNEATSSPSPFQGDGCAGARRGAISQQGQQGSSGGSTAQHGRDKEITHSKPGAEKQHPAYTTRSRGLDYDADDNDDEYGLDESGHSTNRRGSPKRKRYV